MLGQIAPLQWGRSKQGAAQKKPMELPPPAFSAPRQAAQL